MTSNLLDFTFFYTGYFGRRRANLVIYSIYQRINLLNVALGTKQPKIEQLGEHKLHFGHIYDKRWNVV